MNMLNKEKGKSIQTISIQTPTWVRFNDFNGELVREKQAPVTRTEQIEILMDSYSRLRLAIRTLEEWQRWVRGGEKGIVKNNINDLLRDLKGD